MKNCIPLLLSLVILASCSGEPAQGNDTDTTKVAKPEKKGISFDASGLEYIRIGDELTWAQLSVPGATVKDTVFEEKTSSKDGETVAWNVKVVRNSKGVVYLESDFLTFKNLGRVRIESPEYYNPEGIHVGSTVADLLDVYPDLVARPFTKYGVMEIIGSGYTFHIPLGNNTASDTTILDVRSLPQSAVVERIVLAQ